jgi:ribosomal protein L35AE/L33A
MGGSDRTRGRDGPTLGARVLMAEIDQIAKAKHLVGHRVAYKMNDKGEHVIALIFPPQPP